jgi:hypothetical protein
MTSRKEIDAQPVQVTVTTSGVIGHPEGMFVFFRPTSEDRQIPVLEVHTSSVEILSVCVDCLLDFPPEAFRISCGDVVWETISRPIVGAMDEEIYGRGQDRIRRFLIPDPLDRFSIDEFPCEIR